MLRKSGNQEAEEQSAAMLGMSRGLDYLTRHKVEIFAAEVIPEEGGDNSDVYQKVKVKDDSAQQESLTERGEEKKTGGEPHDINIEKSGKAEVKADKGEIEDSEEWKENDLKQDFDEKRADSGEKEKSNQKRDEVGCDQESNEENKEVSETNKNDRTPEIQQESGEF